MKVTKKILNKDIRQVFSKTKGRFFSIMALMALGAFALVGLEVTGPNIRTTGQEYLAKQKTADLAVIADYGLDKNDQKKINELSDKATIEYGYFKDVVVQDSSTAFRIFSSDKSISKYELVDGKLPEKQDEIAIQASQKKNYPIGSTIKFTEKTDDTEDSVLKVHQFKVTGYVNSPEMLSNSELGLTTVGTGELKGYAIVPPETFNSDVYMVARIRFNDTQKLNAFSDEYVKKISTYKKQVVTLLKDQSDLRLATIKSDAQKEIDKGQKQVDDAKQQLADGLSDITKSEQEISDGEKQITSGQDELTSAEKELQSASSQIADGKSTLASTWSELESGRTELEKASTELSEAQETLNSKKAELTTAESLLADASAEISANEKQIADSQSEIDSAKKELASNKTQLEAAQAELNNQNQQLEEALAQYDQSIDELQSQLTEATGNNDEELVTRLTEKLQSVQAERDTFANGDYSSGKEKIAASQTELDNQMNQLKASETELSSKEAELQTGITALNQAKEEYAASKAEFDQGKSAYDSGFATYQSGLAEYQTQSETYESSLSQWLESFSELEEGSKEYQANLAEYQQGLQTLSEKEAELEKGKTDLAEGKKTYNTEKEKAEKEIAKAEKEIADSKESLSKLSKPTYSIYTRREMPGSDGYTSYENTASIIDAVGNVFPVILYFVAALVTFTTMTRFVDEERINAGTLKALGYSNRDIMKKFMIYGLIASMLGTGMGIIAGHTLLPLIINSTYVSDMVLPWMSLGFYPLISLLAIGLGLLSAVVPAYIVSRRELKENAAQLLLPKPPTSGSKILLERIPFIWKRFSFTHKVTARNIFRYKQRMLMTIFGVCGSIALLFTGLGVRSSISDLNNRQFKDIIRYDMIVSEDTLASKEQKSNFDKLLNSSEVESHSPVYYEDVTKTAGDKNDEQSISLIVSSGNQEEFSKYINLLNRTTQKELSLEKNGVVISERLANLTNVKVGDTLSFKDSEKQEHKIKVSGIAEMYMGHFIFMSPEYYQTVFGKTMTTNASLLTLSDDSTENTEKIADEFLKQDSVQGVVQNASLKDSIKVIVDSLNIVMLVLIIASILLAIVILYNLTNINVSERIRELSTIKVLGFYNKEVTLYIYRETICLSIVGILVGFGLGSLIHEYMLTVIPPDSVMFNPVIGWEVFIFPAAVVISILFCLGIVVNRRLRNVDMLEALKSVE